MLWILLFLVIAPTCGIHLKYLSGVLRLHTEGYTDYYFSCNLIGDFLRWEYNSEPLRGFGIEDAGRVVVITGPTYEYTATLLSSQLDLESNQQRLDSVLVLSFVGDHPSSFEVTCSSNSEFTTENVTRIHANAASTSSSNEMVVLQHIASSEIVHNKNKTHIFICGAQNDQLYYEVQSDLFIGFTEHDEIGEDRTVLSQDGSHVSTQSVLFARLPYRKTSLLFVTENSDVTVTCYFGTTQVVFNSINNKESTDLLPTSTHIASVTITTSGALVSHTTTVLPSATYEMDDAIVTGISNVVAATIASVIFGLGVTLIIIIIIMVAVLVMKMKRRVKYTCEEASHTMKIDLEIYCKKDQPNPPMLEDTPSIETSPGIISSEEVLIKSIPGETKVLKDLESSPPSKIEQMETLEDNSSEEASLRICESSIHHFGHEHGGTEPVKSFGSLQEAVFIGANGLGQSYWNASVSESSDVVECDENPDVATTATGITFKVLIQNKDNNVDVTEKFVYTTCDTHNSVHTTEEGNKPHDDVCITEDEKDSHEDVRIMEEDKDALDHVPSTEEDKDALGDVPVTEEDKDPLDQVPGTEEDQDAHGNVDIMEEDKRAKSDKRASAEEIGAQSGQDSDYYIKLTVKHLRELTDEILITNSTSSPRDVSFPPLYPYHKELHPADHLAKMPKKERVSSTAKNRQTWREVGLGWGTGITSLIHGCVGGSMDKKGDVYRNYTRRYWNVKVCVLLAITVLFSAVSMKGDPGDAVNSFQVNSFNQWLSLNSITEARKSITEICPGHSTCLQDGTDPNVMSSGSGFHVRNFWSATVWRRYTTCPQVPPRGGDGVWGRGGDGVVGASLWWGRVRLDMF